MKEENEVNASELSGSQADERTGREEVYTKIVRAGNRTYFFDVKATRKNDLYLTITESKKRFNKDGKFFFEKHKIFLYPEDFDKFADGLDDAFAFIANGQPKQDSASDVTETVQEKKEEVKETPEKTDEFIDVEFEDLGEK
jgi:hypothetical protein